VTEDVFGHVRPLLFTVAYDVLGSAAEAEDVVQDAWLRWSAADRGDVRDPKAYLVRVTTNLALNRLRAARARREAYVGPWLPEPLAAVAADGLSAPDLELEIVAVNGAPAVTARSGGQVFVVVQVDVGADGLIEQVHVVLNPEKLTGLEAPRPLAIR
jgi:DNA-directed RNA polymerase specialized sigma24 family protein